MDTRIAGTAISWRFTLCTRANTDEVSPICLARWAEIRVRCLGWRKVSSRLALSVPTD